MYRNHRDKSPTSKLRQVFIIYTVKFHIITKALQTTVFPGYCIPEHK